MSAVPPGSYRDLALDPSESSGGVVERGWRWVADRALRPVRPRLEECLAAVRTVHGGRAAFELLATRDLLPVAWLESDARGFYSWFPVPRGPRNPCRAVWLDANAAPTSVRGALRYPESRRDASLIAADAPGVLSAEQLAGEYVRAIAPWRSAQDPELPAPATPVLPVWVARAMHKAQGQLGAPCTARPFRCARDALLTAVGARLGMVVGVESLWQRVWRGVSGTGVAPVPALTLDALAARVYAERPRPAAPPPPPAYGAGLFATVAAVWQAALLWRWACENNLVVPERVATVARGYNEYALAPSVAYTPFRAMRDPFEALLALWSTGYSLSSCTPEAALLVLPEPPPKA